MKPRREVEIGRILIDLDLLTCSYFEFIRVFTVTLVGFLMFDLEFNGFSLSDRYLTFIKAIIHVLIVIE